MLKLTLKSFILLFILLVTGVLLSGCQSMGDFSGFFERSTASLANFFKTEPPRKQPIIKVEASAPQIVAEEKKDVYQLQVVRSGEPLDSFQVADTAYAQETTDFGFPPISSLVPTNYHEPVTIYMPGGKLISTYQLHQELTGQGKNRLTVINVLEGETSEAIPGSIWLSGAGAYGRITDATQRQLDQQLDFITGNDKQAKLVFYCASVICWSSFNAALRAVNLGYRNVHWYRGGLKAWYEAGLPTTPTRDDLWPAAPGGQELAQP
jgi:PQQ-dependent catabolism-associated CXXCW motif protein